MSINMIPDRRCDVCGKPVVRGMTDDSGMYCHEECFTKYMDDTYGTNKWQHVADDGLNGYYIVSSQTESGVFYGTGIYYTEWGDEYEDMIDAMDIGAEVIVVADDNHPYYVSVIYWKDNGVFHKYSRMQGDKIDHDTNNETFIIRIKQYVSKGAHVFVRG